MSGKGFNYYKSHSDLMGDFNRLFNSTDEKHYTDSFLAECMLLLEICSRKILAYYGVPTGNKHRAFHYTKMCSDYVPSLSKVMYSLPTSDYESLELAKFNALRFSGHPVKPSVPAMRRLCGVALQKISVLELLGS